VAAPDGRDPAAAAGFGVLDAAPEPDDFFKQGAQFLDLRIGHVHLLPWVGMPFHIKRVGTGHASF
jgi:hypothetical protein